MIMESTSPNQLVALNMEGLDTPPLTLSQLAWRRFRRHRMAMFGAIVLALLFLYSFGGSLVLSESYANHTDTSLRIMSPSAEHLFGTDSVGRHILALAVYGRETFISFR